MKRKALKKILIPSFYFILFFLLRLIGSGSLFALGFSHLPPRNAPTSAQPNFNGTLQLPSLSHQHFELAHERPSIAFLCHQLANGPPLHELTRHGLRRKCQPSGEACDDVTSTQLQTCAKERISRHLLSKVTYLFSHIQHSFLYFVLKLIYRTLNSADFKKGTIITTIFPVCRMIYNLDNVLRAFSPSFLSSLFFSFSPQGFCLFFLCKSINLRCPI